MAKEGNDGMWLELGNQVTVLVNLKDNYVKVLVCRGAVKVKSINVKDRECKGQGM